MIMFRQLTPCHCLFAPSPELDGTIAFQQGLILDACAAKDMRCCGFKSGLRISRLGMITHCQLPPARPHDIQNIKTLLDGFQGTAPADKGFLDACRHSLLLERHNILAVTPPRKNMKAALPEPLLQFCKRHQKACRNRRLPFDKTFQDRSDSRTRSLAFPTPFDP